jgi:hypothetical protein
MRWVEAFNELSRFVAGNREIRIEHDGMTIPEGVRSEFYRRFDAVRTVFLEEGFRDQFDASKRLSETYRRIEREVINRLGVDRIVLPAGLDRYLHEPTRQLIRGLFDLLFDLVRGRIGPEVFAEIASKTLDLSFRDLYPLGYEKWVALNLVHLFGPEKSFCVPLRQPTSKEVIKRLPESQEPVPPPVVSNELSFEHEGVPILVVPDFIVYAPRIDRYMAMRSDFRHAIWMGVHRREKGEWAAFDSLRQNDDPVDVKSCLLVYQAEHPDDLALIADSARLLRPDLVVECMLENRWHEPEELNRVKRRHDALKPGAGSYVVSRSPAPEAVCRALGPDVRFLSVGFEGWRLAPLMETLM